MGSKNSARSKRGSIPAEHDFLGHPELRDKQGPSDGETSFRQIPASTSGADVTKVQAKNVSGNFKFTPAP